MSLISLPPEVIVRAFRYLDPDDIRIIQTVCRYFREIITSDLYLQYMLELYKCGYVLPEEIRRDISYEEMIKILRNQRSRWHHMGLDKPASFEFRIPIGSAYYETLFSNSIYAISFRFYRISGRTPCLHFYEFPSLNKGTDHRYWVHSDLGFNLSAFAIQPEMDLVVLLERCTSNGLNSSAYPRRHLRIHSRTINTDAPHPLAAASPELLDMGDPSSFFIENSRYPELYGRTLIIQLKCAGTNSELDSIVILFDWIAGVQVGRIELKSDPGRSIRFLSDEYLIIPQGYQDMRTPSAEHIPQYGKLLIFHLPPPAEGLENRQVRQVVTLLFPRISTTENRLHLYFNHGAPPVPKGSYRSAYSRAEPKIYDFNRWNHLCLYYESFDRVRVSQGRVRQQWCFEKDLEPIGLLYISSDALLALLYKQSHDLRAIPWEVWKACTVSLPIGDTPIYCMSGVKSAFKKCTQYSVNMNDNQLIIVDFLKKGRSSHLVGAGMGPEIVSNCDASSGHPHTCNQECDLPYYVRTGRFIEPGTAIPMEIQYKIMVVDLNHEKYRGFLGSELAIDDEQLAVLGYLNGMDLHVYKF